MKFAALTFAVAVFMAGGWSASAAELLAGGQPIIGVAATPGSPTSAIATAGTVAGANNYPVGESPNLAIDGATGSKYLNFAEVNCGFIITIPGGFTTVTGLQFSAANDASERDPITVTIEGTTAADPLTAATNATWTLLYSGASGLAGVASREGDGAVVSFTNTALFNTYRMLVTSVRSGTTANSMQFSEIQFFGSIVDTAAPTVASTIPARGSVVRSLFQIEVFFNEPVDGVDAADLLINGTPATGIIYAGPNQFAFDFPQPPTGAVTVAFAPGHGIRDQASPSNQFAGDSWTYTLDPNAAGSPVVISEFMAVGGDTLHDEDGDGSDWIELYNPGPTAASLVGHYLTDVANNLTKWRIPNVSMAANSYLVIFASGKNRTNNPAKLHTNFQLASGGEYLALVDPLTNVISDFYPTYPSQSEDVSYGRDRLNPALLGYFNTPTPGAANSTGGAGFAPEVQFSRDSGTFVQTSPFLLTLSTPSSNAVIYYTLGTNRLSTNSLRYSNPILITNSTLIQARAFEPGLLPGPIALKSFIALANQTNILNFRSTLPVMILHNFGLGPVPVNKARQFVVMQTFEPKGGFTSITNAPDDAEAGSFHVRGSSTAVASDAGKSSFFLKIQDAFEDKKTIELMGLPNESDWVLYAPNGFEPALIHNPLAFEFARQQGEYASRFRFFELYLKDDTGSPGAITSADYHGVMVLEEKIKRDVNRINISELEPEHLTAPEITGGYMFSIDRTAPGESQLLVTGGGLNWIEPDYDEMILPARAPQVNYIRTYFNDFATALTSPNWTNPVTGYNAYIDVNSWVTRHLHEVITFNVDALRLSGYLYKDRNKKIEYGPAWDYDRTQGSTDGRDANPRTWRSQAGDLGTDFFNFTPWWGRLFQSPDFWQRWIDRYQDFRETVYHRTNVIRTIDSVVAQVQEAQPRDFAKWPRNLRTATGGGGGTYATEILWKKTWYSNRLDFIDTNFLARPQFNTNGGMISSGFQLVLAPPIKPGSSMYYTLDGSDPRASGGAVAPGAQLYGGPITLNNNTRVTARTFNSNHRNLTGPNNPPISSPWSGPRAATFVVHTPDLIVTELMYHPAPPTSQTDTNDADNFEYIELKNVGTNTLNLIGFRFTNGIDYTFTAQSGVTSLAPGAHVLVVKHLNAFNSRYGGGPAQAVAGEFAGNFDNAGERVTLVGPALETVLDFDYSDEWFNLTDGIGFSLVVQDQTAFSDLSTNTSWRISSVDGGSPGAVNPAALVASDIVIVNEALTHTDPAPPFDTIELFNPGTNDVNIGGWWLTDDFNTPKKFQVPAGTIVPAGGFVLFDETQFNPGGNGFALGSDGDELHVFSGGGGFITGYHHGFNFGAAQNGRTFGRYIDSQGTEHFVAQATNSLGSSNSLPLVGPIIITEIMYHPPELGSGTNLVDNSLDEFIELHNISATNVPLYHTLYPSNTWRLSSAVDFSFPTNTSIPSGGYALVVNFNSASVPDAIAFRTKYGVPESVPLYGPYSGKLDNSSESVRLGRPDMPNGPDVPFIVVDRVDYRDLPPWPVTADGLGASLQRLVNGSFGNDPTNWAAARTSAGGAIEGGAPPVILQQPIGITVTEGMTTNISVVVSSSTALTYQWQQNSNPVPGATSATLVFSNIVPSQSGTYTVGIFNGGGSAFSIPVVVNVLPLPVITLHPQSQNVASNGTFTLTAAATGTGPLRYQWRFTPPGDAPVNIPNATNTSLIISNANLFAHGGNYEMTVTDDIGTRSTLPATVIVLVRPSFILQPVGLSVLQGQSARFTVQAVPQHPLLPLTYRWIRNGVGIQTSSVPVLVLSNVQPGNPNPVPIRCAVTNLASGAGGVNSTTVNMFVLPDFDGDGMADSWEVQYGFNTNSIADGSLDLDSDGMINRDEYVAGTLPADPSSLLKLFTVATNAALLQFVAQPNIAYTVQYRTNFVPQAGGTAWNTLTNITSQSGVRTVEVNHILAPLPDERYLRVVTPPPEP